MRWRRAAANLLLNVWRARATAVLLVTHDRAEATFLADRILMLGDRPAEILTEIVVPPAQRSR